jgi:putative serine protease PepD
MSSQLPSPADAPDTPWWRPANASSVKTFPSKQSNSFFIIVSIVIALLAGGVGATIGRSTSSNISGNFVNTEDAIERAPGSIADLASRVIPGVVSISVEAGGDSGTGSGFFLSGDGYILTNNHVVEAAATRGRISVAISTGKKYTATIVGRDSSYDLAVLKIDVTGAPSLQLGDSDKAQVGDAVIAIGSPLGLAGTVTSGILSAKNRAVTTGSGAGESSFINALQTDAAINPGNSGGPLVDATGAVVGVNSAIASLGSLAGGQSGSIGLGFAIPINQAKKTAEQLIKTGSATYPIMGIAIDTRYNGVGALISSEANGITPNGPAAKAGLKAGDLIIEINGKEIQSSDELIVAIRSQNVGDQVKIKFKRNAITREVTVTLAASKK